MHEIKKSKVLLILAAVILLGFLAIGGYLFLMNQAKAVSNSNPTSTAQVQQTSQITVSVKNKDVVQNYDVQIKDGDVLIDLLNKLATSNQGFSFAVKDSTYGSFLTTVNGVEALDAKREFWQFNINGSSATEGIGTYKVKSGDKIEFVLASY